MKTKIILAGLIMLCLSFSAFAQNKHKKQTPIEYNNDMADITDSLYQMGKVWGEKFNEIFNGNKNFNELAPERRKIASFITRKTEAVKTQPLVGKGAEGLKSAVISFLNFESKMINVAFADLEKLNSTSSQEEIDEAVKALTNEASKEGEVLKLVNAAQEAYGQQNGFSIEPETAEE